MYDFVVENVYERYYSGQPHISVSDAMAFFAVASHAGKMPALRLGVVASPSIPKTGLPTKKTLILARVVDF